MLALFNVGNTELLIILFVALLVFGSRLPSIMRSLGKSVVEFKRGLHEMEDEVNKAGADEVARKQEEQPTQKQS